MRSSNYKQKPQDEARKAKIQQMYKVQPFWPDLKLLFMVTGAYYESGLCVARVLGSEKASMVRNTSWQIIDVIKNMINVERAQGYPDMTGHTSLQARGVGGGREGARLRTCPHRPNGRKGPPWKNLKG